MVFNRFALWMLVRVVLLTMILMGLSLALTHTGYYGLTLLLTLIAAGLLVELYRYVSRTNAELARFLDAARYEDFGQRFQWTAGGAGFERLTETFGEIMARFKDSRRKQEERLRYLQSLTEHIPVPLLSLYSDGRIQLHNNAARRLFSGVNVNRIQDLDIFGADFSRGIKNLEPGSRGLVNFSYDGMERQLAAVMTRITAGTVSEKLISMQDIQSELDDVQLDAWRDLVSVLTHEIMNSITPVASLAETATDLVDDVREKARASTIAPEDFEDVRHAVDTVARRSNGLMQFVRGYRSLTIMPEPRKQTLELTEVFGRVKELVAGQWQGITLDARVEPPSLTLPADPDLLEQVLINLLRNAEQALRTAGEKASVSEPRVAMTARMSRRGHVLIEVSDNGPGIPADMARQVFVPFYTSKPEGSGVGLALTRQIMIAHGGSVALNQSDTGGAKFTLFF